MLWHKLSAWAASMLRPLRVCGGRHGGGDQGAASQGLGAVGSHRGRGGLCAKIKEKQVTFSVGCQGRGGGGKRNSHPTLQLAELGCPQLSGQTSPGTRVPMPLGRTWTEVDIPRHLCPHISGLFQTEVDILQALQHPVTRPGMPPARHLLPQALEAWARPTPGQRLQRQRLHAQGARGSGGTDRR